MAETNVFVEPGKMEIIINHVADAPRELVFKAFTDPEIYAKWIGPRGMETNITKFEPVNGGSWRYVQKDEDGNEFGFHGVNHEVKFPERIIGTFEFEGLPESGHVLLQTAKFTEQSGKTKISTQSVFQSLEDREGMVMTGMERGIRESYQRLDEILAEMQK
jgi:uncharacterized protein YndB with AHSA1/START domain